MKLNETYLINTDKWFVAPDGETYNAVFGTVKTIHDSTSALGVKTNSRSTNWYVEIGNMMIAGCQIHTAFRTNNVSFKDPEKGWALHEGNLLLNTSPSRIYNADTEYGK